MSIIQLEKRIYFRQHIKGMSHHNLHKYATENPLIPKQSVLDGIAENVGHAATIQNYCQLINAQIFIDLPDIPSLRSSQQAAIDNAGYWLGTLNPLTIRIYREVITFCNYYSAYSELEFNKLVDDIGQPGGAATFLNVLDSFKTMINKNQQSVDDTAQQLVAFSGELASDLRNFEGIKQEADNKYLGQDGILLQLQSDMVSLEDKIKLLNIAIGVLSAAVAIGILMIAIGVLFSPVTAGKLAAAGIAIVGGASGALKKLVDDRNGDQRTYRDKSAEFDKLEQHCAVLQKLSNDFESLAASNEDAGRAIIAMVQAWQEMGEGFAGISDLVEAAGDQPLEEESAIVIKKLLSAAFISIRELKEFAEQCRDNGIIPVIIEDAKLAYDLHLPRAWLKTPIPGMTFQAVIEANRRSGSYNRRGRRRWHTRDRRIISR